MLRGPVRPLLTSAITIGSLLDAAQYSISHIRAIPAEDVAVIVLAPAASAPIAALIALCSLSTGMNSVVISPFAIMDATNCGISVDGVMGNAGITSGFICFIACPIASFPDILVLVDMLNLRILSEF